jgi:O-acetyl-ADP-ribose deacetylase (regulator of RNase III)
LNIICGLTKNIDISRNGGEMSKTIEVKINKSILVLLEGDITNESTDAIVNAANSRLAGGGGVDGAIHKVGGPSIMEECRKIYNCPTGHAAVTTAGKLRAKYIIHTVGPRYQGGNRGEAILLKSAYLESLKLASARKMKSIAFPAISTGIYGYPVFEAAYITLKTIIDYLKEYSDIELVRFVLFDRKSYDIFSEELKKLL